MRDAGSLLFYLLAQKVEGQSSNDIFNILFSESGISGVNSLSENIFILKVFTDTFFDVFAQVQNFVSLIVSHVVHLHVFIKQ